MLRSVGKIIVKIPGVRGKLEYLKENLLQMAALFVSRQLNDQLLCAELSNLFVFKVMMSLW